MERTEYKVVVSRKVVLTTNSYYKAFARFEKEAKTATDRRRISLRIKL